MKSLLLLSILLLSGCDWGKVQTYNLPFIEDGYTFFYPTNQKIMCDNMPNSIFCKDSLTIGDIQPTRDYVLNLVRTLDKNADYKVTDEWYYNHTVYEYLLGDCEDETMTLGKHMIDDGIDKKYLHLVWYLTSETSSHLFLAVDTIDAGMLHVDINTGAEPIEPQINWHMRMDNAGIYKWIKGNIK